MNKHIDTVQILDPLVVAGRQRVGWIEFVVGEISAGYIVFVDLVGDTATGMIETALDHLDPLTFV